ncbi:mevalonate kinase [Streptomyces sp. NPDC018972]|uniref:mevalonate kinase n=1 Tax=Streptomyces sp. NPDC018972 TaxID=3365060 RepID=UPI0037A4A973
MTISWVAASAPGRICLAGENLDWMTGGRSVVTSISLRTYATFSRSGPPDSLIMRSLSPFYMSRRVPLEELRIYLGDELDYIQASAKVVDDLLPSAPGGTVSVRTELPVRSGVSSSAALTLAVVGALLAANDVRPDTEIIRNLAHSAESDELRTGAGWMDFLACGEGGVGEVVSSNPPRFCRISNRLSPAIILIDTGHRSTSEILRLQRSRWVRNDPDISAYAEEAETVAGQLIQAIREVGIADTSVTRLIQRAHGLLRDRLHCTTPLIDRCVDICLQSGSYAAKLSGCGHGGCVFALVPERHVPRVVTAITPLPVQIFETASDETGFSWGDAGSRRTD